VTAREDACLGNCLEIKRPFCLNWAITIRQATSADKNLPTTQAELPFYPFEHLFTSNTAHPTSSPSAVHSARSWFPKPSTIFGHFGWCYLFRWVFDEMK